MKTTTSFKQIRIDPANANSIEAALKAVNGKATAHTYTAYAEIKNLADFGERRLERMEVPKSGRAGASVTGVSGDKMPNAYKHARQATVARVERRSAGWYLAHVGEATLWPQQGGGLRLSLTATQDADAVRRFRSTYDTVTVPTPDLPEHDISRLATSSDPSVQRVVEWLLPQLSPAHADEMRKIIAARRASETTNQVLRDIVAEAARSVDLV